MTNKSLSWRLPSLPAGMCSAESGLDGLSPQVRGLVSMPQRVGQWVKPESYAKP